MALSAKNFQNPLLRTLGKLSNFTAGVVVSADATYDGILAIMGITDPAEHGTNDASGQPQVIKWIQWANKNCVKAGLTENPAGTRGKWTLTNDGVKESWDLATQAGDEMPNNMTLVTDSTPATPAAPVLNLILPTSDVLGYHHDAYVRKLAIDQTGCFGNHSSYGASVCPNCPLRSECRNRQISEFSKLALVLAAEEAAPAAPAAAAPAAAAPSDKRFPNLDFSGVDIIKNKAEAICAECGQAIAKDERCRWVEDLPDTDDGGLFHLDCSGGE
jgi:hypothetical protein